MNERDSWMIKAACRGAPIEWFYPPEHHGAAWNEARSVCRVCPVREECLEAAMEEEEHKPVSQRDGMRGLMTPRERSRLAKIRRLRALSPFDKVRFSDDQGVTNAAYPTNLRSEASE